MTLTVERPAAGTPDAGVIEEARARQLRHRGAAAAATLAAAAIAAILLAFAGGSDGSHPGRAPVPAGGPSAKSARSSSASCISSKAKALQGAPSRSLLSILGVLRRPATPADALPRALVAQGAGSSAFVHYVRRTRVVGHSPYYIYPAILEGCGSHARQGIMHLNTNIDLGGGAMGATGGGGATAAHIEHGEALGTGPPGSATSSTIAMIVPDGVAKVTLRFPAGRASGYSPKISPPFTITTAPVNNELIVRIPRSGGGGAIHQATMTWRAANGHTLKTFNRL
ncbi:MAG TPA: hypothetical protein VGX26_07655 [Solirubrobacteraceae bacterium]|jgi:hypothetical protein|nr:hypothetical protein [Solirubrobacteraceae bacterium]